VIVRNEWWRYELLVSPEFLADPQVDLERFARDTVRDFLRAQGGTGDPNLRIWRVRPSAAPDTFKLVVQGDSLRRVG
jgi:hypothetical protein